MARHWFCGLLGLVLSATFASAAGYDDFARGLAASDLDDDERVIAAFSAALAAGDLNPKLVPVAYFDRARAYLRREQISLALADLGTEIRLRPAFLPAYLMRAFAEDQSGDATAAVSDYSHVLSFGGNDVAYFGRGRARWNARDFAGAVADFTQVHSFEPENAYAAIWLAIARQSAGAFDNAAWKNDTLAVEPDHWPGLILAFYRGSAKSEEVFAAAAEGDAKTVAGRRCEANFYLGEWLLAQKQQEAARSLLVAAHGGLRAQFHRVLRGRIRAEAA